jgi:hypothetical protein
VKPPSSALLLPWLKLHGFIVKESKILVTLAKHEPEVAYTQGDLPRHIFVHFDKNVSGFHTGALDPNFLKKVQKFVFVRHRFLLAIEF